MTNTADTIWRHARSDPGHLALRGDLGTVWDYATLRDRIASVAGRLRHHGVRPGDRVLLIAPSVPEFAGAYYGIHAAGAIAVTANTMAPSPELTYIGDDAGVSVVLGWGEIQPAPAEAAAALGVPYWSMAPDLAGLTDEAPVDELHDGYADDTASILYTSGTTGRPKGAQLTHGNLISCAEVFCRVHGLGASDRSGTALPLFHVFGQACVMGTVLRAGASLSLLSRFDAEALVTMLRDEKLTHLSGVPTMWNAILHAAEHSTPSDFASLRLASSGGASLPMEILRAFQERLGCAISEGYGLTETTGAATCQHPGHPAKAGTVGTALPGFDITIRSEDGDEVSVGEVGEVFVTGPTVMKGYWKRPDATAETLRHGRLVTGDLGSLDDDGNLTIIDRKKDLVIRGGYNVYPREVEEVLYEHPDIVEVAVLGIPDDHYGEEVAAVVALRSGASLDASTLRAWAKERLSAYKVPHLVAFVDELPKGATGKILKRAIDPAILATAGQR